jgi:hypothetical protein
MGKGRMACLSERPGRNDKSRLAGHAAAAGHRRWVSRCRGCATEPCGPVPERVIESRWSDAWLERDVAGVREMRRWGRRRRLPRARSGSPIPLSEQVGA